jgi:serine/threonine protein kinase
VTCPHCGSPHPDGTGVCPLTGQPLDASRPAALVTGEILDGKYQIIREIGRGAMGVVYEALHIALGRKVAVKTLLEGMTGDANLGERFQREARAASAIGHPNIVDVFDLGRTQDGLLFMVMELLDGLPLSALLKQTPKLPIPLALHLMAQVLSGLGAAHKQGIVHRDLKPDNIFVLHGEERANVVKIVDFGISKVLAPEGTRPKVTTKGIGTMVGSVLGTPLYMSPEQAIGQVTLIDHRTDVYSAGVVLYEMLCGRTPFGGETYAQILGGLLEGNYPPVRSLRPDVPPALEAAIVRALDRDLERRFPTAAAMRSEIAGGGTEVTPAPVVLPSSIGDALPLALGTLGGDQDPPATPVESGSAAIGAPLRRSPSRGDLFAPPPEHEASPLLADDLDRPLAVRSSPHPRPQADVDLGLDDDRPRKRTPPREIPVSETPVRAEASRPPWLALVAGLAALAIVGAIAYRVLRARGDGSASSYSGEVQKVVLLVKPDNATVQIDHIPVRIGEIPIDSGGARAHVLNAAAPGRLTRRFSFTARTGAQLKVRLRRTLPAPTTSDPPPLPMELAADYPDNPRSDEEIDRAFAKLDHYADCLALTGDASADGRKSGKGSRLRGEELGLCKRLLSEATGLPPSLPELETAAETYLSAVQAGQRLDALARLATTFRAEYLAARTAWQMEELSRQGKDEGQKAAWHMRRVAMAGQAWARARKLASGGEAQQKQLDEYLQALTAYVAGAREEVARILGADDFVSAAQELAALARAPGGRRASDIAALEACRKMTAAFDALVVE